MRNEAAIKTVSISFTIFPQYVNVYLFPWLRKFNRTAYKNLPIEKQTWLYKEVSDAKKSK